MRRGVGIAWAIGALVIVALFAYTMGPRHAAPPRPETSSAPPPKNPPMTSPSEAPKPSPAPPSSGAGERPPDTAGGAATPELPSMAVSMPAFPWPPPRYSAFATIVREAVADGGSSTLRSVGQRLEAAFDRAGYGERSYYWVPGGFALVSRIEQIRADATPVDPPARWAIDTPQGPVSFVEYVRALFNAPPGFYRVIVFAVTDQDFAAGPRPPSSAEARAWASSGSLRLPATLGNRPYTQDHYTTALIYEFERRADRTEAEMRTPSNTPGQVHLERAGLWQALAQR